MQIYISFSFETIGLYFDVANAYQVCNCCQLSAIMRFRWWKPSLEQSATRRQCHLS